MTGPMSIIKVMPTFVKPLITMAGQCMIAIWVVNHQIMLEFGTKIEYIEKTKFLRHEDKIYLPNHDHIGISGSVMNERMNVFCSICFTSHAGLKSK